MSASTGQPNDEEDFKALNFVRKSLSRKNDLIRTLRKQLEELQYEFEALKRKCNNQQSKLDSYAITDKYSAGSNTKEYSEDVAGMQSEHTRANSIQLKAEILDDNEQSMSIENEYLLCTGNQAYGKNSEDTPFLQTTQFEQVEVELPVCEEPQCMAIEHSLVDQATTGQQSGYTGNGNWSSSDRCSPIRELPQQCLDFDGNQQRREDSRLPGGGTLQVKGTVKRHKCCVCGHVFRYNHHLEDHLRTHTGEKPFVCPLEGCGYRSAKKSTLSCHFRRHTQDKPFACLVEGCGYRARQKGLVKSHMCSQH